MRLPRLALAALAVLMGCADDSAALSIADAEAAGFSKDQQQLYQMIGAVDGWSGEWVGETVELYQFADANPENLTRFQAATQPGNISGWVELCDAGNLVMLSKGQEACNMLRALR